MVTHRWRRLVVAIVLGAVMVGLPSTAAADIGGERIRNYRVVITVQRDGAIAVDETIDYDFGSNQRHGILRDVPVRFHFDDHYDRMLPLTVLSVHGSPGTPDGYKVEHVGALLRIRIGDPKRTVTGLHTYTINYRVEGALNGFSDHDELYWNAIGAFWDVPVDQATVKV